jgi:hypothetical protein
MAPLYLFVILQVLDVLTTLVAMHLGGHENNFLIARLMSVGPVGGLLLSKFIVIGLAALGIVRQYHRGVRRANLVFAGVVVWNLTVIMRLAVEA